MANEPIRQGYSSNYNAQDSGSGFNYDSAAVLSETTYMVSRLFGGPFLYTDAVDPQIDMGGQSMGRMTAQRIMHDPTIISLMPGKVKASSGRGGGGASAVINYIQNGGGEDGIVNGFESDKLLFTIEQDYNNYANYVNLIASIMAIYMGIGEDYVYLPQSDGTAIQIRDQYKNMDWRKYQIKGMENTSPSGYGISGKNILATVDSALRDTLQYVHFYGQNNSSYSEESQTSTRTSAIESAVESALNNDFLKDAAFLSGLSNDTATSSIIEEMSKQAGLADQGFGQILSQAGDYLRGGHMAFPQMIEDSNYGKSISLSFKFVSPYGDPKSVFNNCMLPLAHLMALALPRQLNANTYTYPFLIRLYCRGWMNCEMGVVTSFRVQRGGTEDTQWTFDTLATEIDVSMDITPLYSDLMISKTTDLGNFFKNTGLQEYLGTICGINMKGSIGTVQLNIAKAIGGHFFRDIKANLFTKIGDKIASVVYGWITLP